MTTALATLIRLRPAPELEPPFEGEEPTGQAAIPIPTPAPLEWPSGHPWPDAAEVAGTTGEAHLAARRYLALCVEILGGFRPLAHLRLLTSATAYERIAAQLTGARAGGRPGSTWTLPHPWPGDALRVTAGRLVPGPGDRVVLRHVRVCEPLDGVAEVAAVLGQHEHVWAMALRLERHHGGWLCHHLEVV